MADNWLSPSEPWGEVGRVASGGRAAGHGSDTGVPVTALDRGSSSQGAGGIQSGVRARREPATVGTTVSRMIVRLMLKF